MTRKATIRHIRNQDIATNAKRLTQNSSGFGYEVPPDFDIVFIYFDQKGQSNLSQNFFQHFQKSKWKTGTGYTVGNWKVVASDWIFEHEQSLKLLERKTANILK